MDDVKRRCSMAARPFTVPNGVQPKVDAIRRLTNDVNRLVRHFKSDSRHWRSLLARRALEYKLEQRAAALVVLKEQAAAVYQALCTELNLTERNVLS